MLQRLIAAVLAVLGLAAIGLGVASATAWRADDPLVATAAPGGSTRTLVTDPGVLELAGDPVTVTVRAEGSPVVLVLGRDTDVTAWVGDDPYARVTGLSDWHTLRTTAVPATAPTASPGASGTSEPAPSPSPSGATGDAAAARAADPTGNDMWVAEVTGDGSATLEWPAQDGRWSLLAVSLGDTAPVLDLSWPQTVTTPWLWPGVALGVLLLAAAAILLVRILRRRREGPDTGWHSVTTGQLAIVPAPGTDPGAGAPVAGGPGAPTGPVHVGTISATGAPLTRRQIREAEAEAAAAAAAARRRGRRNATGAIPTVTGALPTVTGAVPTVPGATSTAGRSAHAAGGTAPDAATAPAPGSSAAVPRTTPPSGPAPSGAAPSGATTPGSTLPGTTPPGATPPGATPPGATPPGTTPPGATTPGTPPAATPPVVAAPSAPGRSVSGTSQPAAGTAAPTAPTAPTATSDRPTSAVREWAGTTVGRPAEAPPTPAAPPAEAAPPVGDAAPGTQAPDGSERRGLASRLPWRRTGRQTPAEPATAPVSPTAPDAPQGPGATGRATSWAPVPDAPAGPGRATPPPAAPAAPAAPGGTPSVAGDDDPAVQAQRADAWRRMWGFPSDAAGPDTDEQHGTEEGR